MYLCCSRHSEDTEATPSEEQVTIRAEVTEDSISLANRYTGTCDLVGCLGDYEKGGTHGGIIDSSRPPLANSVKEQGEQQQRQFSELLSVEKATEKDLEAPRDDMVALLETFKVCFARQNSTNRSLS